MISLDGAASDHACRPYWLSHISTVQRTRGALAPLLLLVSAPAFSYLIDYRQLESQRVITLRPFGA